VGAPSEANMDGNAAVKSETEKASSTLNEGETESATGAVKKMEGSAAHREAGAEAAARETQAAETVGDTGTDRVSSANKSKSKASKFACILIKVLGTV